LTEDGRPKTEEGSGFRVRVQSSEFSVAVFSFQLMEDGSWKMGDFSFAFSFGEQGEDGSFF
jgi:hypothetical protein